MNSWSEGIAEMTMPSFATIFTREGGGQDAQER